MALTTADKLYQFYQKGECHPLNGRGYGHVTVFGRPFVKRFALCYQTVVYLSVLSISVLSVTLAYCGQTVE